MKNDKLKVAVFLTVGIVLLLTSIYFDRYNNSLNLAKYVVLAFGMTSLVFGLTKMRRVLGY
jgi:hypothetical protein